VAGNDQLKVSGFAQSWQFRDLGTEQWWLKRGTIPKAASFLAKNGTGERIHDTNAVSYDSLNSLQNHDWHWNGTGITGTYLILSTPFTSSCPEFLATSSASPRHQAMEDQHHPAAVGLLPAQQSNWERRDGKVTSFPPKLVAMVHPVHPE
jgi:hypothetical protein